MAGDASRRNGALGGRPRKDGSPATPGGKRLELVAKVLTPKQALFVVAYCGVCKFNGTAAYMRAFEVQDPAAAGTRAARLLKMPHVAAAVLDNLAASAQAAGIMDGEEAMMGISRNARWEIGQAFDLSGKVLPVHEMPLEIRDSVKAIKVRRVEGVKGKPAVQTVELTMMDKGRPRELLAKAAGRLKDKIELEAGKGLVELLAELETELDKQRKAAAS